MPISEDTATQIALAYREVTAAIKLLAEIEVAQTKSEAPDIRDAFGRRQRGLQLGVPNGDNSRRLFDVPWELCKPIIEAHISRQQSLIDVLSKKALVESEGSAS